MMKQPHVIGIHLGEKLEVNPQTGLVSLVGIFQALRFAAFPSAAKEFVVYSCLYGGEGEGTMEMGISFLTKEQDIFFRKWWFTFPDPDLNVNLIIPIKCFFPYPGRYSVVLRFDEEILATRFFQVFSE